MPESLINFVFIKVIKDLDPKNLGQVQLETINRQNIRLSISRHYTPGEGTHCARL